MTPLDRTRRQIQHVAAGLLHSRHVDLVLGYRKAGFPLRTRPVLISQPSGTAALVWSSFCSVNLAVYLPALVPTDSGPEPGQPQVVAVLAKPCDARCVLALSRQGVVARDRVFLVVVRCPGIIDWRKVEDALGGAEVLGAGEDAGGNLHVVVEDGSDVKLPRWTLEDETCGGCRDRGPADADLTIDLADLGSAPQGDSPLPSRVPGRARLALDQGGMSRCILCRACDRVCPFGTGNGRKPTDGPGAGEADAQAYHLARVARTAGLCCACGACARLCPSGIDPRPPLGGEARATG
jgi:ferredoxin